MLCTSSELGLIQPGVFESDTDSQEEEEVSFYNVKAPKLQVVRTCSSCFSMWIIQSVWIHFLLTAEQKQRSTVIICVVLYIKQTPVGHVNKVKNLIHFGDSL